MAKLPTLPADVSLWPSYRYWRQDADHLKQLWYVSFCLMMSSVQDRLTGLALRETGNLNWATSAFYYSAVHSARLLCLLSTGDYPKGHAQICTALDPSSSDSPPVTFDWLATFLEDLSVGRISDPVKKHGAAPSTVQRAVEHLSISMLSGTEERVQSMGRELGLLKKLRNDSNYEALLIAHERRHEIVEPVFLRLADAADATSRQAVDLALAVHVANVADGPTFNSLRPSLLAVHLAYADDRFALPLREKFEGSRICVEEVRRVRWGLDLLPPLAPGLSSDEIERFLGPIRMANFGGKAHLMDGWQWKVDNLADAIRERG
jgi:hypothetical protein